MGLLVSAVVHAGFAWLLSTTGVAFPPPPSAGFAPHLVDFREPEFLPPPEMTMPRPVAPIVRPRPPAAAQPTAAAPPALEPPELIPHDLAPRLINGATILEALTQGYPDDLPAEAARTRVLLWLFVDTGGNVTESRVQASSGFEELDALATRVAPRMEYSPARYRGERVAVWVAQRIRFQPSGRQIL